jgi:K+ transporter
MDKKVQQIDPKAKVNPDRIKEAYAFVGEMTSVIENLIDNKEIQNPNELAQSVVLKLLLGERLPAGIGKEGKKVIQKLNKTNKAMIQFLKDIRSGVSPITEDKKRNAVPKIKTKTIKSAVATQLGFFNEDVITDILNSLVKSGANIVTDKMVKSLLHKKVITKATRVGRTAKIQVQDVT